MFFTFKYFYIYLIIGLSQGQPWDNPGFNLIYKEKTIKIITREEEKQRIWKLKA